MFFNQTLLRNAEECIFSEAASRSSRNVKHVSLCFWFGANALVPQTTYIFNDLNGALRARRSLQGLGDLNSGTRRELRGTAVFILLCISFVGGHLLHHFFVYIHGLGLRIGSGSLFTSTVGSVLMKVFERYLLDAISASLYQMLFNQWRKCHLK